MVGLPRWCAVCGGNRVYRKQRLCPTCLAAWGTDAVWVRALVELTDEEHRSRHRRRGREVLRGTMSEDDLGVIL
jgi:hypothetical protein